MESHGDGSGVMTVLVPGHNSEKGWATGRISHTGVLCVPLVQLEKYQRNEYHWLVTITQEQPIQLGGLYQKGMHVIQLKNPSNNWLHSIYPSHVRQASKVTSRCNAPTYNRLNVDFTSSSIY